MRLPNRIWNYWFCQIFGWGIVSLVYICFGYTFGVLSTSAVIKVGVFIFACFLVTHFLRLSIKKFHWLSLPAEKGLAWLIFATNVACVIAALIVAIINRILEYCGVIFPNYIPNPHFTIQLVASSIDQALFIVPWSIIYYFYHYIQNNRRQVWKGQN